MNQAVTEIEDAWGRIRIAELSARLGLGGRRLERAFQRQIGVSPKLFTRIVRFQRVFELVQAGLPCPGRIAIDWAMLALDCGYFDQSHLIRDFRRFSGQSPAAYFDSEHRLSDLFIGQGDRNGS